MGDSEDEYDRKRRDKFRGERVEGGYRPGGIDRPMRPRDDWNERPRSGGFRGGSRDANAFSPTSMDPPMKRSRVDYFGGAGADPYYNAYGGGGYGGHHHPRDTSAAAASAAAADGHKHPMSFKEFLVAQDDNISVSDAVDKYNDYRLEFQRQQLNEFFVAHKDEEWFRLKYHPEDALHKKEEQASALKKRIDVFLDLYSSGALKNVSIDIGNTNELIRLLDTVVVKLEDGTDEDFELLEQEFKELGEEKKPDCETNKKKMDSEEIKKSVAEVKKEVEKPKENEEMETEAEKKTEENKKPESESDPEKKSEVNESELSEKAAVESEMEVESSTIKESEKNIEEKEKETEPEPEEKDKEPEVEVENLVVENGKTTEENGEAVITENGKKLDNEEEENGAEDKEAAVDPDPEPEQTEKPEEEEMQTATNNDSNTGDKETHNVSSTENKISENGVEKMDVEKSAVAKKVNRKPIHKTTSIFLRNLTPSITFKELEDICAKYDGFLRISLSEPQSDRRWMRRGWLTFTRDANIKDICWNLNNVRIRDCELGSIVNRDLSRRIRQVNGITAHKRVVKSDIRISAKIALHMDSKAGLWTKEGSNESSISVCTDNPVLQNITDYLIEEASAEEEELLGLESTTEAEDDTNVTLERDDALVAVLDRIVWYLRIVHSIDYYNHCEYPNEDEMPNRCGILHARGPVPLTKTDITSFLGAEVETKMVNFLPDKSNNDKVDPKLLQMALKVADTEVEKFVQANTRELSKDKWLCPLSGKKFKGADFVRKHIFNEHGEKIDEVKKEVEYFNNYLRDPKRPSDPTTKRDDPPIPSQASASSFNSAPNYNTTRYFNPGFHRGGGGRGRGGPGRNPGEYRPIVQYRDLDAPRELEELM